MSESIPRVQPASLVTAAPMALAQDTGNAFAVVVHVLPPYDVGMPLHIHPYHAEGYYVVEGTLVLMQGDQTIMLGHGSGCEVLPGVAHTCWNPTATPTTVLLIHTPGTPLETVEAPSDELADTA